jgi:hypothetical protein
MEKETNPAANSTALKPDDGLVALSAFAQKDYNCVDKDLGDLL